MPVEAGDSQSIVPQAQASELAKVPFDTAQLKYLLHRFSDCLQNMPVSAGDSQSALPQAQASESAAEPSMERQSQYRSAIDAVVTSLNMSTLDAMLSTHAALQNRGCS